MVESRAAHKTRECEGTPLAVGKTTGKVAAAGAIAGRYQDMYCECPGGAQSCRPWLHTWGKKFHVKPPPAKMAALCGGADRTPYFIIEYDAEKDPPQFYCPHLLRI